MKMLGAVNTNMVELPKKKLYIILKAIEALLIRTNHIKGFVFIFNNDHEVRTLQTIPNTVARRFLSKEPKMLPIQLKDNLSARRFIE